MVVRCRGPGSNVPAKFALWGRHRVSDEDSAGTGGIIKRGPVYFK